VDVVDPEILFRHYLYVTATSDTIAEHNIAYADTLVQLLGLGTGDLVVEAASNDGSLLQCFKGRGARTLGIEPATNLAEHAASLGIETVNTFLTSGVALEVRAKYGRARAVIANNVLAHVDNPLDFLTGCRELVDASGVVCVEVPYVRELLEQLEYDTVYHEHLCYFSMTSLVRGCERVGLSAIRVDRLPVHGGSLRLYLVSRRDQHAPDVLALVDAERRDGLNGAAPYRQFANRVQTNRTTLSSLLETLRADGKRIAGYGAPAKGNTLLNYCGIDTRLLPYTVDKNMLKVGLYTPGAHIPVRPVSALTESASDTPDYVLILAWNFADEIMRQQQTFRDRGGQFILPIPVPRVV
jgi:hypothetical protein